MSDQFNEQPGPASGSRGTASVTLRDSEESRDAGLLLDSANRSALEALRIAYTIMSWIMVGLIVLFVLSGFQSVSESERAVRLRFGRIDNANIGAGFQFAYPPPIGELIKIPIGQQSLRIDDAFYPELVGRQRSQTVEELASRGGFNSYDPTKDGSLITADQNLAHAKWQVLYERTSPTDWLSHIDREKEEQILRLTIERAVVRAMAETTIEELIKQSAGSEGSVARRAEQFAQQALDRLESGIRIVRLDMVDPAPPLNLYNEFAAVNSAQSNANAERDRAQQDARTSLNQVAGGAAEGLIELMDRYERASDLGDTDAQTTLLAAIEAVLTGQPVTVEATAEGEETLALQAGAVSGEVTRLISDAETYRRRVRDRAQADLTRFRSKLEQYRANRQVLISREWADAVETFLKKDTVQAMFLPEGSDIVELLLSRDPQILRDQEKIRNRELLNQANEERKEQINQPNLRDVNQTDR